MWLALVDEGRRELGGSARRYFWALPCSCEDQAREVASAHVGPAVYCYAAEVRAAFRYCPATRALEPEQLLLPF